MKEHIIEWLRPTVERVDAWLDRRQRASARIVSRESSIEGRPLYYVEVRSFGTWIRRFNSGTFDYDEAYQRYMREIGLTAPDGIPQETVIANPRPRL